MALNLRDRLKRIHEYNSAPSAPLRSCAKENDLIGLGWKQCGFNVMEREVVLPLPFQPEESLPDYISILIKDLRLRLPEMKDLLFFDLETTGLSTGAGTTAFLAAFGMIKESKLFITQYLLLDYPGENDFLENVLAKLNAENSVIVSYNGKCYDSQIIRSRCLINRMKPPVFLHVDLLHPARRLWKKIIHDCSQSSVETKILGLSRDGDIPGALAPVIWFDFLNTGNTEKLTGICDHNISDIFGLSVMFSAIISIASDLFNTDKYLYDTERLARSVYDFAYRQMVTGNYDIPLELINKAIKVTEPGTLWYSKLKRRKVRLEKLIEKEK
ncbi:MAG: ribonuclease H-like domain-containing protein [Treponema sp.]|nr:ribonuclease H-like domain-containing protein [Treponema sp.]